jgi:DNA end-binding protein Ku
MAARSSWKGYLKLSLVSVPVKAYTATSSASSPISLNQLHETCNSRIKYQKVCPIHGEVSQDEIVSGYEYSKGQYVVIDPAEIDKLRTENDKSVNVTAFVRDDAIDPIYLSGRTYYLVPDGPVGQKAYNLIRHAMAEEGLHAVAQVVLSNKEQVVLVRPMDGVLAMSVLEYKSQVKEPSSVEDEIVETELSKMEVDLTKQLIEGMFDEDFDLGQFHDVYTEKLTELIEAKVAGKELVSPPESQEPGVINLMDALKQSVQQVKPPKRAAEGEKPAKKTAASAEQRSTEEKTEGRKTKSG